MNDREHAEEILQTARRDLRALRAMHDVVRFLTKAWLAFLGKPFPKTHDLKQLIN